MQIDFTNLFNSCDDVINVDTHFDFDDFEYSTYKPLKHGADVKGKAYCKADVAYLDLNVKFDFFGICDRCAEEFEKNFSFDIHKTVVPRMQRSLSQMQQKFKFRKMRLQKGCRSPYGGAFAVA